MHIKHIDCWVGESTQRRQVVARVLKKGKVSK